MIVTRGLDNAYIGGAKLPGGRGKCSPSVLPTRFATTLNMHRASDHEYVFAFTRQDTPNDYCKEQLCFVLFYKRYVTIFECQLSKLVRSICILSREFFVILGLKCHPLQSAARDQ